MYSETELSRSCHRNAIPVNEVSISLHQIVEPIRPGRNVDIIIRVWNRDLNFALRGNVHVLDVNKFLKI